MNTYNVVILGPKGSGKTVYLGSLYHKLSTPGELGYFISAPMKQGKQLNALFTALVTGWPEGTTLSNMAQWDFSIRISGDTGQIHHAASIAYYDYAGSRLTEFHDDEVEAETEAMVNKAHVFLGLLDGAKLYKELRMGQRDDAFWNEHVKLLCDRMTQVADKTIHFVISKWDLFADSDSNLREVRTLMEEFPPFKNLVESRKRFGGITRLIPVSSVGYGYCDFQADGSMVKRSGAQPRPLYVETPFACALPDLIETEFRKAKEEAARIAGQLSRPVEAKLTFWERLKLSVGRGLAGISKATGLKDPVIDWLAETAQKAGQRKLLAADEQNRLRQLEAEQLRKKINDENSAIIYVLESMTNSVAMLERAYPSSKIA